MPTYKLLFINTRSIRKAVNDNEYYHKYTDLISCQILFLQNRCKKGWIRY